MSVPDISELIPKNSRLPKDDIDLRERFIAEFLKDGHKWNAAVRLGYTGEDNYYFVLAADQDPYIQKRLQEISEAKKAQANRSTEHDMGAQLQKLLHISNSPTTASREKIAAIRAHTELLMTWEKYQADKALEAERRAKEGIGGYGVMLVPAEVPLDQWEAWAKWSYSETMKKMEMLMQMENS